MNNHEFVGKICPYCKCVLTEEDEIVVCSDCEMPHHRDCWIENQGCTTFGCQGTIAGADGPATSVTSGELVFEEPAAPVRYCAKCGTSNPMTSGYCRKCGNALAAAQIPAPEVPVQSAPAEPQPEVAPSGKICSACGTVNAEEALFCKICASRLAAPVNQPEVISGAVTVSAPAQAEPAVQETPDEQTESRFCPKCGSANSAKAAFCRVCGGAMPAAQPKPEAAPAVAEPVAQQTPTHTSAGKFCAKCGSANGEHAAFCRVCGASLSPAEEPAPVANPAPVATPAPMPQPQIIAQSAPAVPETRFCSKCGTANPATSGYCRKCGNAMNAVQPSHSPVPQPAYYPAPANSGDVDPVIQQLVGVNTEYYLPKFWEMRTQNKMTSWNWAAFLVTPYWMIYRKMYVYGAVTLGVVFLLTLLGANAGIFSVLALAGYAVCGVYANYLYMYHLDKLAQQARAMSEPYRSQFIATNSGVNMPAAIGTLIGWSLLVLILF